MITIPGTVDHNHRNTQDPRVKRLERENARLKRRLKRVELMLDIQKKASEMLGIPLSHPDKDEND